LEPGRSLVEELDFELDWIVWDKSEEKLEENLWSLTV
jgi:hypothetical protein